jgi:hypothetical protein
MDANYFTPKSAGKFYCNFCDFTCCKNSDMKRHNLTLKHENAKNANSYANFGDAEKIEIFFACDFCEKKFKHASSLSRHKKKCECALKSNDTEEIEPSEENSLVQYNNEHDLVLHLLNQNKQLQEQIIELCKDKSITNNTINNNSHNKTFNLQVFLNETCKDAMNLTDFVDSLQIQLSDLEKVGKDGFVAGISNIIMKNLKALDVTMRPVHCSDQKRETMYIKDQNQWHNDSKELPENQKLKKAIKQIAHKNICLIPEWKKKYPDCIYAESRKSDLYNHIMYEAMDHNEANSEKIIKKIAKEVGIAK